MLDNILNFKDNSIDEASRPEDRRIAAIGALSFLILLLIVVFWRFFSKLDPAPEPGGLMASFGNVEFAGGGASTASSESTNTTNKKDVESSEMESSASVSNDVKPNSNNNTKVDNTPKGVSSDDLFGGGTGPNSGKGTQGTPNGIKDDLGNLGGGGTGGGKGKGDGPDEGKEGSRRCKSNCSSCNVKDSWDEDGEAFVSITIDSDGKVKNATMADPKKYPKNAGILPAQAKIAKKCAEQRQYQAGSGDVKQVVRITFRRS
jgi:hypothetical protein